MTSPCSVWDRVTRVSTATGAAGVADGVPVAGGAVDEQAATASSSAASAAAAGGRNPRCLDGRVMGRLLSEAAADLLWHDRAERERGHGIAGTLFAIAKSEHRGPPDVKS